MQRLPSFTQLRAFEAAARLGSFNQAARSLFVTQGAISQNIKQLEEFLGVALFRRRGRHRIVTDAGRELARELGQALHQIGDAIDALRENQHSGELTVSTLPSFAMQWLIPRLGRFRDRHPGIKLRIDADERLVDLDRDEIDLAIRYGPPVEAATGQSITKLMGDEVFPVCSRDFRLAHPPLSNPQDLRGLTLIHDESDQVPGHCDYRWDSWLQAAGVAGIDPHQGPSFYEAHMVIRAAIAGQGVALTRASLVRDELRTGQLCRLFEVDYPIREIYYLIEPGNRRDHPRHVAFREWLLEEARQR